MMRWDIFCAVIDNYGDIGVCWRLARQLAAEYGFPVRLWVDDLGSLHPLCPEVDPSCAAQMQRGVEIRRWAGDFADIVPADVVIEAFGCRLPENYLATMAAAPSPRPSPARGERAQRVWINLEYLSAESWVEGCHGLASPHPRLPLTKYFFFPGFTPATGGLLRERDLLARRDAFRQEAPVFRQSLGIPAANADETLVSLFCYDTAPIRDLLTAWETAAQPVRCLLPAGKALAQAAAWAGRASALPAGDMAQRGNLTLHVLPFLRQEDYDRLLWLCDCNFVRGEDSFVRAQWAARPLVWHIYPQQEEAHLLKLEAFLERYCADLPESAADAVRDFHRAWNGNGPLRWDDFRQHQAVLQAHAAAWAQRLSAEPDLASKLVIFCKNRV